MKTSSLCLLLKVLDYRGKYIRGWWSLGFISLYLHPRLCYASAQTIIYCLFKEIFPKDLILGLKTYVHFLETPDCLSPYEKELHTHFFYIITTGVLLKPCRQIRSIKNHDQQPRCRGLCASLIHFLNLFFSFWNDYLRCDYFCRRSAFFTLNAPVLCLLMALSWTFDFFPALECFLPFTRQWFGTH